MKVEIKCKGSATAKLSDLKPFQGDLKILTDENYEKAKAEIIDLGFSFPFFVWSHQDGKRRDSLDLFDGHQRLKILNRMVEEGIELPEYYPIVEIDAKNFKEAKRKVLAATSNYGTMTKEGLLGFMDEAGLDIKEVVESFTFDSVQLSIPVEGIDEQDHSGANKEIDTEDYGSSLVHKCPKCNFEFSASK